MLRAVFLNVYNAKVYAILYPTSYGLKVDNHFYFFTDMIFFLMYQWNKKNGTLKKIRFQIKFVGMKNIV